MAADITQTFAGKHIEKVVVAVAAVVFIGAIAWFIGLREPQEDVLRNVESAVQRLEARTQETVTLKDALTPDEQVALGIDRPGTTVADLQEAVGGMPPPYQVAMKIVSPSYGQKEVVKAREKQYAPAEVLPPEEMQVAVGYGVTDYDVPRPMAQLQADEITYNDIAWASCVAKFDLTQQLDIWVEPYLKDNRTPPINKTSPITITRVEVRRRQILPDGTATDWEGITPSVPAEIAAKLPSFPEDNKNKPMVGQWYQGLVKAQAEIRRLPFYTIVAIGSGQTAADLAEGVTGVKQPNVSRYDERARAAAPAPKPEEAPAEAPGAEVAAAPEPAPAGASPWEMITRPERRPTEAGIEAAVPTEREHVYATVWANDATVLPGKTYQYQMRVAILNPVWSLPDVEPADQRWTLEFVGPWSDPTVPLTVPELMEFYFVGTFGNRVNLELHQWMHGQWIIVPSAPSYVGAPVVYEKRAQRLVVPGKGDTVVKDIVMRPDAMLVDVIRNFPYQPGGRNRPIDTNVLVFSDRQGNVGRRIEWEDQERARDHRIKRKEAPAPRPRRGR
jgi:hypothetical protein